MHAIGAPLDRIDGPEKATGAATYAYEFPIKDVTYAFPVQSTIAKGRIVSIDASAARALSGVITVLSHENAPRLAPMDNAELDVLQSASVAYHGQFVAAVVRTTHRMARLDVPVPSFMRAPGECPGMFALESAMDEMAIACKLDPIEFRIRNEPEIDPETGHPFSSRGLVACLREGARRFGWEQRDPRPRVRQEGRWLVGTGVAASTYPVFQCPYPNRARVFVNHEG